MDIRSSEWKLHIPSKRAGGERAGPLPSMLQKAFAWPCFYGPCVSQDAVRSVSHPTEQQHKPPPFEKLWPALFFL